MTKRTIEERLKELEGKWQQWREGYNSTREKFMHRLKELEALTNICPKCGERWIISHVCGEPFTPQKPPSTPDIERLAEVAHNAANHPKAWSSRPHEVRVAWRKGTRAILKELGHGGEGAQHPMVCGVCGEELHGTWHTGSNFGATCDDCFNKGDFPTSPTITGTVHISGIVTCCHCGVSFQAGEPHECGRHPTAPEREGK